MKLKKLWLTVFVVLISVMAAFACIGFTACDNGKSPDNGGTTNPPPEDGKDDEEEGDGKEEHTHTWATEYSNDETGHWYAVTCGHDVDVKDYGEHMFDGDYVCTECGYRHEHTYSEDLSSDDIGHWYAVTCGHDVDVKDYGTHTYDEDYVCTECEYVHTHTYDESDYEKDENYHWYAATCGHEDAVSKAPHDFSNGACVCGATRTSTTFTGKIYLVGDSTVCSFNDNYYLPRYGYGTQLYNYLNLGNSNQVVNLALSGRSSLSYLTETNYTTLKNSISAGDYLIIGFGHNDEKSTEPARYTDANGTYDQATTANGPSFAYTLYENYIKLAEQKGATAILCTPIVRYDDSFKYSGAKVHDTSASDSNGMGGDYSEAIRQLGRDTNTAVIDLTEITKAIYLELKEDAAYFHAHTTYDGEKPNVTILGRDDTHINMYGAKRVAYELTKALLAVDCRLKFNVVADSALIMPTYENDFAAAIKESYIKPDYKGFDPSVTTAKNLGAISGQTWYASVMGEVGGASKLNTIEVTNASGVITVSNNANNGKITDAQDGFGAAFIQIDSKKDFTASATVKITSIGTSVNSQSCFGIMLRDDIYVNEYMATLTSNYVVAGALGNGSSALFSRENAELVKSGNSTTVAVDSTFTVTLTRTGQTVVTTLSDGTRNYSKTYTDFDFVAVDNDYMYLCLIGNRGLAVEYSNIAFEITGDSQGA